MSPNGEIHAFGRKRRHSRLSITHAGIGKSQALLARGIAWHGEDSKNMRAARGASGPGALPPFLGRWARWQEPRVGPEMFPKCRSGYYSVSGAPRPLEQDPVRGSPDPPRKKRSPLICPRSNVKEPSPTESETIVLTQRGSIVEIVSFCDFDYLGQEKAGGKEITHDIIAKTMRACRESPKKNT